MCATVTYSVNPEETRQTIEQLHQAFFSTSVRQIQRGNADLVSFLFTMCEQIDDDKSMQNLIQQGTKQEKKLCFFAFLNDIRIERAPDQSEAKQLQSKWIEKQPKRIGIQYRSNPYDDVSLFVFLAISHPRLVFVGTHMLAPTIIVGTRCSGASRVAAEFRNSLVSLPVSLLRRALPDSHERQSFERSTIDSSASTSTTFSPMILDESSLFLFSR